MSLSSLSCQICGKTSSLDQARANVQLKCAFCGCYILTDDAFAEIVGVESIPDRHLYSGAVRELYERSGKAVTVHSLQSLLDSVYVPKNPVEQLDKLILHIQNQTQDLTQGIEIVNESYPIVYGKRDSDFQFCLRAARDRGLTAESSSTGRIKLTFNGWSRAVELSKALPESRRAFVAMWFGKTTEDAWSNGIKPALEECGYQAIRIDKEEHNGKIDDRIIAEIRKSGLVIADFTGHRGGVYFEAGFAMGLGVPVIFTCSTDSLKGAHFDTRQYNHIIWDEPGDLKEKLINRIEATIITQ